MNINHTDLEGQLRKEIKSCNKEHDILNLKSKYLGKKGLLTALFSKIKSLDAEQKKSYGYELNQIKNKRILLTEELHWGYFLLRREIETEFQFLRKNIMMQFTEKR